MTLAMTSLVLLAHVHVPPCLCLSRLLVGTKLEGFTIAVLCILWASIVSIVTDTSNHLAVISVASSSGAGNVVSLNGNLYYFSWAGFVTSILLLVSYLREAFGVDLVGQVRQRAARLQVWTGLLASALVVLGSSARVFQEEQCSVVATVFCGRTKFALAVGAMGVVMGLLVVAMKLLTASAPFGMEFVMAIFLCVLNAFGVSYITSPTGPGSSIGNLYYFSWINFLCAAMLLADCFQQYAEASALRAVSEAEREEDLQFKDDNSSIPIEESDTYDSDV
jgi:hypothetical protein